MIEIYIILSMLWRFFLQLMILILSSINRFWFLLKNKVKAFRMLELFFIVVTTLWLIDRMCFCHIECFSLIGNLFNFYNHWFVTGIVSKALYNTWNNVYYSKMEAGWSTNSTRSTKILRCDLFSDTLLFGFKKSIYFTF